MHAKRFGILLLTLGPALACPEPDTAPWVTVERAAKSSRVGLASWYGGGEPLNTHVAMGHPFDAEAAEAAMWGVPFGSVVKVTNLKNHRSVVVRITDRGPAKRLRTRVIDLTRGSFSRLAPLSQGLIPVMVQQLPRRSL